MAKNQGKDNPDAYCASIERNVLGTKKMKQKTSEGKRKTAEREFTIAELNSLLLGRRIQAEMKDDAEEMTAEAIDYYLLGRGAKPTKAQHNQAEEESEDERSEGQVLLKQSPSVSAAEKDTDAVDRDDLNVQAAKQEFLDYCTGLGYLTLVQAQAQEQARFNAMPGAVAGGPIIETATAPPTPGSGGTLTAPSTPQTQAPSGFGTVGTAVNQALGSIGIVPTTIGQAGTSSIPGIPITGYGLQTPWGIVPINTVPIGSISTPANYPATPTTGTIPGGNWLGWNFPGYPAPQTGSIISQPPGSFPSTPTGSTLVSPTGIVTPGLSSLGSLLQRLLSPSGPTSATAPGTAGVGGYAGPTSSGPSSTTLPPNTGATILGFTPPVTQPAAPRPVTQKATPRSTPTAKTKFLTKPGALQQQDLNELHQWQRSHVNQYQATASTLTAERRFSPTFYNHFKADILDGKSGRIKLSGVYLDYKSTTNKWHVDQKEEPKIIEGLKSRKMTVRLAHSKEPDRVIGRYTNGWAAEDDGCTSSTDGEALSRHVHFEAISNPQDPQMRTNIIEGYVADVSPGLDAEIFCDDCGEQWGVDQDKQIVKTCDHDEAEGVLRNIEPREGSLVVEPAFEGRTSFRPSFSAAMDGLFNSQMNCKCEPVATRASPRSGAAGKL